MRRFLTKLAESPLAQTWLVLGMLAIAFIVDEVGVWINDDSIAKVYCEVMIPFVYVLYLALFLIGLVLFWCGMAWLILFAPDIRRSCQERRVCSQATSGI